MTEHKNRIFVSIGVSKPRGGLEELPGAITAAERMAAWAQAQDYETVLIHDEDSTEITVELLREKISAAIVDVTNQTELKRLVIFFAGHGGSQSVGDQFWLLTNWDTDWNEAIRISSLQRILEFYGPEQVAVIGDACQEYSARFSDVIGSAVLRKVDEEPQRYELDQFLAVGFGKQAFMIKAKGEERAFCLFTEVLLDALEGDAEDNCFEEINGRKVVTSQSLAHYLDNNVAREAATYGLLMDPCPKPGFYTDRIYLTMPEPPSAMKSPSHSDHTVALRTDEELFEIELLGATRGQSASRATTKPQKDLQPRVRTVSRISLEKPKIVEAPSNLVSIALDQARMARRQEYINRVGSATMRDHFETSCGICVSGADVAVVAASFGIPSRTYEQPNWFRIELNTPGNGDNLEWSDTLVTLADGRMVSVCAIKTFISALHIVDETSISLLHYPIGADPGESYWGIELLAQLHADLLTTQEIIDSAAMLRVGKHRIITVGCIAAQFYDAIRDVDSLHSMAAFYAMNNQPVPLDIILYGSGIIREHDGRLYTDIPAVAERKARTPQEASQRFTYMETPEFIDYPIAGRIPWMRQAWGAVETARCNENASGWQMLASATIKYLAPGDFTVSTPEGGEAMLNLAGIKLD
jgi:hypothetical protein